MNPNEALDRMAGIAGLENFGTMVAALPWNVLRATTEKVQKGTCFSDPFPIRRSNAM